MARTLNTLKHAGISVFVALALIVPVFAVSAAPAAQPAPGSDIAAPAGTTECLGGFSMTIRAGTNAGKSIAGVLTMRADNVTGELRESTLKMDGGGMANVTGSVIGHTVAMVFDLGDGKPLFGIGVMQKSLTDCNGIAAGPFVGPERDSRGDWDWYLGNGDNR